MVRSFVVVLVAVVMTAVATASGGSRFVSANGVRVLVHAGWSLVPPAGDGTVVDPRTLLVVGTEGVAARGSVCQIGAYRVQPDGAVVVVVGWRTATSGGGRLKPGRAPLAALRSVRRPSFECFSGRGASAQVALRGRAYQVSVMVGDRAPKRLVAQALAIGRSFGVVRDSRQAGSRLARSTESADADSSAATPKASASPAARHGFPSSL